MPLNEDDLRWQESVNPETGQPFTNYDDYVTWSKGMEQQSNAGGSALATQGAAPAGSAAPWGTVGGLEKDVPNSGDFNWGNTGWGVDYEGNQDGWYQPPPGMAGFTYGVGQAGYINPKTGEITFGLTKGIDNTGNPGTGGATYNPWQDYGLGPDAAGVIPIGHDARGGTTYYVPTPGGGYKVTSDLQEAIALSNAYRAAFASQQSLDPNTGRPLSMGQPGAAGPQAPTGAAPAGPGTTEPGALMVPGQTENYWDSTKDFYTQPTEAEKTWDATANQPTNAEQTWNAFSGQFNQPSNAEDLYGNYRDIFADPNYLNSYWDNQEKNARGALEGRAAAAGVGDSSMAMRATGNLSSLYAGNKLTSMQDFAKTGMGLATGADTGFNQRAAGAGTLSALADKGINDRISTANLVDQGMLARTASGQNASNVAQSATQSRLTGGLTSATNLANDIAQLTSLGLNQAQAEKFMTDLQAISLDLQSGNLSFEQAMARATEMANLPNTVSNTYFQYWLASKLMSGTGGK
jgi:hypothetical protein